MIYYENIVNITFYNFFKGSNRTLIYSIAFKSIWQTKVLQEFNMQGTNSKPKPNKIG